MSWAEAFFAVCRRCGDRRATWDAFCDRCKDELWPRLEVETFERVRLVPEEET